MRKSWYFGQLALGAGVCLIVSAAAISGTALAASPEYCAVYAHASSDPNGAASASADDTEALQRAYDKAYYECLNLDDEPKLPADFADRGPDPANVGEGDVSDAADENPVIKKDQKPVIKKKASVSAAKKTASVVAPKKKKQQWRSGYESGTPEWVKWCTDKYNSFDPKTGMYKSYSGVMKTCK